VRRAGLPLLGFLLPRTLSTSGAPSPPRATLAGARGGRGLPHPRRCRPQGSCPSRRFRQHAARSRLLDPAVRRGPRRFAAFFHAARVPGASLQSFPFPRSRTRSRGPPASLRVRVRRPPLQLPKDLHDRFRQPRASSSPLRAHPEVDPGLESRDGGSPRSLGRSPRRTKCAARADSFPSDAGLRGEPPTRPLRSFAPPGSPFRDDPETWPGRDRPSVLSWESRPPELSPPRFGVRSLASTHAGGSRPRAT